jgi:hypothetical protein
VKEVTAEVYALHEPDEDPWYVGCTGNGIDNRFADHQRKNPLCGPRTQISVIETVTGTVKECGAAEVAWIDYGREVGWPLVNGPEDRPWKGPNSEAANKAIRRARTNEPQALRAKRRAGVERRYAQDPTYATRVSKSVKTSPKARLQREGLWKPGGPLRAAYEAGRFTGRKCQPGCTCGRHKRAGEMTISQDPLAESSR